MPLHFDTGCSCGFFSTNYRTNVPCGLDVLHNESSVSNLRSNLRTYNNIP